jgi:hypothetical protein
VTEAHITYTLAHTHTCLPHPTGLINDHQRNNLHPPLLDSQRRLLLRLHHLRPPHRLDPPTITPGEDLGGVYLCLGSGLSFDGGCEGL